MYRSTTFVYVRVGLCMDVPAVYDLHYVLQRLLNIDSISIHVLCYVSAIMLISNLVTLSISDAASDAQPDDFLVTRGPGGDRWPVSCLVAGTIHF